MRIKIEGTDFPGASCGPSPQQPDGYANIHVGVQRRGKPGELLGVVRGDAPSATWTLDATVTRAPDGEIDVKGLYIQGPRGGRFIYLNWGTVDTAARGDTVAEAGVPGPFTLFRRAKLRLDAVPAALLSRAAELGVLTARVVLTDAKGNPTCASVGAPYIEWSAGPD